MTEWQDIETAPKDGTAVLVYGAKLGSQFVACFHERDGERLWVITSDEEKMHGFVEEAASHWMPLPTPPSGESPQ